MHTESVDFDPGSIIASLLISSVGYVLFRYGKKQSRPPQLVTGLVLMLYPYFVTDVLFMSLIGIGLCLLLWAAVRLGL